MEAFGPESKPRHVPWVEGVLWQSSTDTGLLLNSARVGLLFFFFPQRRQSARDDAVSWNLESHGPNLGLDSRRELGLEHIWKGQVEALDPWLGRVLRIGCISDLRVGDGLSLVWRSVPPP